MGRKSIKENKNKYQLSRENMNLTREAAGELLGFVSDDRLVKIESDKSMPHPEEVLAMAKAYNDTLLCNYFCSHECPIGRKYIPEITPRDLQDITLMIVNSINIIERKKNRLIEIAVDGEIDEEEIHDFEEIKEELGKIALSVSTLQVWVSDAENKIASKKL